jgi:hypothetical protein
LLLNILVDEDRLLALSGKALCISEFIRAVAALVVPSANTNTLADLEYANLIEVSVLGLNLQPASCI